MVYGYARCSTNEERQDINRQKRELYMLGVTDEKYIYWEYESGMKDDRTEFNKLLDIVVEGDTITTTESHVLQGQQNIYARFCKQFRTRN